MKISRNYLAFSMDYSTKEQIISNYTYLNGLYDPIREKYAKQYVSDTDTNYILTKSAQTTISNIKFTLNDNLIDMLVDSISESATVIINKNSFFRYFKDGDSLICAYFNIDTVGYLSYDAFRLHKGMERLDDKVITYIKTMIFLKCTNTEFEYLSNKPNKKRRMKYDNDKYIIDHGVRDVTLVNSKFNKIIIRNEKFYVNPHIRFQRHGQNNMLIKSIIIDGYYKTGYTRNYKS